MNVTNDFHSRKIFQTINIKKCEHQKLKMQLFSWIREAQPDKWRKAPCSGVKTIKFFLWNDFLPWGSMTVSVSALRRNYFGLHVSLTSAEVKIGSHRKSPPKGYFMTCKMRVESGITWFWVMRHAQINLSKREEDALHYYIFISLRECLDFTLNDYKKFRQTR
jgi:hypothetical protein